MSTVQPSSRRSALRLALGFALLIALAGIVVALTFRPVDLPQTHRIGSIDDLNRIFGEHGYSLSAAGNGDRVPRFIISAVPENWSSVLAAEVRKQTFFESVLPLVLIENERIEKTRRQLRILDQQLVEGRHLSPLDKRWLEKLAGRHELTKRKSKSDAEARAIVALLLRQIGPVPPSLALAQGAVESAYGTSRFAVEGNAIFGQWTSGDGITPVQQRVDKSEFKIAAFASPLQSVEAYMRNLNSHRAYRGFREARYQQHVAGKPLAGVSLASTLSSYSEKGADYVRTLHQVIQTNSLSALDGATLADDRPIRLLIP
jgi:Bax protein